MRKLIQKNREDSPPVVVYARIVKKNLTELFLLEDSNVSKVIAVNGKDSRMESVTISDIEHEILAIEDEDSLYRVPPPPGFIWVE